MTETEVLAYVKASAAFDKASAAYLKARAAYLKARAALDKARAALAKACAALAKACAAYLASFDVEAWHREVCLPNCPWDGQTIFAKGKSIEVLS